MRISELSSSNQVINDAQSEKKRKYSKSYTEEVVQAALKDINYGMPKKQAAMKYGIHRSTLQFRLSDKFTEIGHGPRTYLTRDEENLLESWILESHRKGFPKRKDDIQASVKSFLENHPRSTPFKDNLPGEHWYQCFLQRHEKLSNRIPAVEILRRQHKENGSELNELSDMDLGETSLEVNPTKDMNLPVVDSYLSESEINDMSIIILADFTSAHLEYTQLTTENPSSSFSFLTIVDNTMIKERVVTHSGETSHSEDCVKNKLKMSLLWPKTPERKGKRTTERLPYVITPSGWKKIYEDKEKAKLEKEKKKKKTKPSRS
ncbi:hypothetical protein JTB14_033667 [Gonioctena quinquepunctata]|nr:hypothetical protein JTB14_033667 [Gonioctena quinquepunctata]